MPASNRTVRFFVIVGIIGGPTGIGKTELALQIAEKNGFSILSADSRQIYRGTPIGTGQPSTEELSRVTHHLIDFLPVGTRFSAERYREAVWNCVAEYPNVSFLVVGGTGFYLRALLYPPAEKEPAPPESVRAQVERELRSGGTDRVLSLLRQHDLESAERIHRNDTYRVTKAYENFLWRGQPYSQLASSGGLEPRLAQVSMVSLTLERQQLYRRIENRIEKMMELGWVQEAAELLQHNPTVGQNHFDAIGYRHLLQVIQGSLTREQAIERIQQETRRYAKKQITFFKTQLPLLQSVDRQHFGQIMAKNDWKWPLKTFSNPT